MFEAFRSFLADLVGGGSARGVYESDDIRLAVAALLVHVADSDGQYGDEERQRAQDLVASRFHLDGPDASRLMREALEADHEEVGVGHFVNILNRRLDNDAKLKVVAMMWDIVYADSRFNDAEDSMVWRIAGMLGVSAQEQEVLRRSRTPGAIGDATE